MRDIRNLDFFRKVPHDLTQGTVSGATISFCGAFFLVLLFVFEFSSYMAINQRTDIVIDTSASDMLRINFNISLPHIPCSYASVDVQDIMKTRKHNITRNVEKWTLDFESGRRLAKVADGVHAPKYGDSNYAGDQKSEELTGSDQFEHFVNAHDIALVNFYAPWCIWCKRLHPVWEATAVTVANKYGNQVKFGKMDCTKDTNTPVCKKNHINAFPTVIIYRNHADHSHEHYHGDRTQDAFMKYIAKVYDEAIKTPSPVLRDSPEPAKRRTKEEKAYASAKGCLITGHAELNKVPGTLFVTVESKGMTFHAASVNFSHVVHDLSFGPVLSESDQALLPKDTQLSMDRLRNQQFGSKLANASHEHYIKVVGTSFKFLSREQLDTYTYSVNSHQYVDADNIPAAKFTYDLSPMSVLVSEEKMPLYHFITSVCAIIGGVFTVIGLIDSMVFHSINALKHKISLGKDL